MKKLKYDCSDTEELISGFRRLADGLRSDSEYVKRAAASGEIPDQYAGDIRKLLDSEAESSEKAAEILGKFMDECEQTEERVKLLVRKSFFEQRGSIIVEKSKTPVRSSIVLGKTLKHDSGLSDIIIKRLSGEQP